MTEPLKFDVNPETAALAQPIDRMLDRVFGPGRGEKASYLYRENVAPVADLSFTAELDGELVGTIRYWPILVGPTQHDALLLGPLCIAQHLAGRGIGRALTFHTLDLATKMGYDLVLLVGDVAYYQRFGFVPATPYGFVMPAEKRPERLQVTPLRRGVIGEISGEIQHIRSRRDPVRLPAARRFAAIHAA